MARRPSKNFFFGKLLRFDSTTGNYKLKTEVGENTTSVDETVKVSRGASVKGNILPDGWTFHKDGNNRLIISYNDTSVARIADSGEVTTITDLVGYGSI